MISVDPLAAFAEAGPVRPGLTADILTAGESLQAAMASDFYHARNPQATAVLNRTTGVKAPQFNA